MKYGLGGVDLNCIAQFALRGLTEHPERDIIKLLESCQPIERETRLAMARALRGDESGVRLQLRGQGKASFVKRLGQVKRLIELGREFRGLRKSLSYKEAMEKVIGSAPVGEKSIEEGVTLSRNLDRWVSAQRKKGSNHSDTALEIAFLYAHLTKSHRSAALKPSVEVLGSLVEDYELRLQKARGVKLRRKNN